MSYDRDIVTTASNALPDSLCQGRFQAQIGIPDVTSRDARFGREIHDALKRNDPSKLTFEQRDIFDSIQAIETSVVVKFFGALAPEAIKHCDRERPYTIKVGEYEHGCTPDVVYRYLNRALVIEYKSLSGDVAPAPSNMQMRDQVVVVKSNYFAVDEIGSAVIQPLATHTPEVCCYMPQDIEQATWELVKRVTNSHAKDPKRTAGEVQCAFCKAKGICREYQAWATQGLPVPVSIVDLPVALWTPQMRTTFCEHMGVADKWLQETKMAMKDGAKKDPDFIPGWGLDEGDERRNVTDMQALWDRFNALGGTLEAFMGCMKLTLGDFEEQVSLVTKLKGKKLKDQVSALLQGLIEIKRTEPALIRRGK